MTPILCSLHWLAVSFRIKFKLFLITHKCLQGTAPSTSHPWYIGYSPGRSLQSADQFLIVEKKERLRTYDRAFSITPPMSLELRKCEHLNTLKCLLKHIYSVVFLMCNWTVILHHTVLLYSMHLNLCDFIHLLCSELLALLICVVFDIYEVCLDICRVFIWGIF